MSNFQKAQRIASFLSVVSVAGCSLVVNPNEDELPRLTDVPDSGILEMDMGVPEDMNVSMDEGLVVDAMPDIDEGVPVDLGPCGAAACVISASNVGDDYWDTASTHDLSIRGGGVIRVNTDTCRFASIDGVVATQAGGPEVCVVRMRALTVENSATLSVRGARPLVVLASGDVVIDGAFDVSARMDEAGPGGGRGGLVALEERDGVGPSPGMAGEHVDPYDDGGGGGGAFFGAGGHGGLGGEALGGNGGAALGAPSLEPLHGGSGGGRGRGEVIDTTTNAGLGGAGAGAIQISSLTRITLNGRIFAAGGGGEGGKRVLGGDSNYGSGAGGGSGGGVLLEAPEVVFGTDAVVVLNGGGGGAAATNGADGGNGSDGALTDTPSMGGVNEGTGANGGDGAIGVNVDGQAGEDRDAFTNGAGGGGGAGALVIRNAAGTLPSIGANVSPSAGTYVVLPMHTR